MHLDPLRALGLATQWLCPSVLSKAVLSVWSTGRGRSDGDEGKKKFMYLKWASHFWLSIQNHIFPRRTIFLVLGGWVGGLAQGGGGVGSARSAPPPPGWISTSLVLSSVLSVVASQPMGGMGRTIVRLSPSVHWVHAGRQESVDERRGGPTQQGFVG